MAPKFTLAFILAIAVLAICPWRISGKEKKDEGNAVAEDGGHFMEMPKLDSSMMVEVHLGKKEDEDNAPKNRATREAWYRNEDCYVNGGVIKHGNTGAVTGSNPCWKSMCKYGQLYDKEDGCYVEGQCYDINREFNKDCVTYMCSKTSRGSYTTYSYMYRVWGVRKECKDAYGGCRRTGEKFPAYINGIYSNNCRCLGNGRYTCYTSGK